MPEAKKTLLVSSFVRVQYSEIVYQYRRLVTLNPVITAGDIGFCLSPSRKARAQAKAYAS